MPEVVGVGPHRVVSIEQESVKVVQVGDKAIGVIEGYGAKLLLGYIQKAMRLIWVDLAMTWTSKPVFVEAISGGKVYSYGYGDTTYYRFVPSTYDSAQDSFFKTYESQTLSNLVATRGAEIDDILNSGLPLTLPFRLV